VSVRMPNEQTKPGPARHEWPLIAGVVLFVFGGCLLHAHLAWGWPVAGVAALLVLGFSAGSYSRLLDAEVLRRPPVRLEAAVLAIALGLSAWSSFSYLNSLAGIHFDTAENWVCIRERMSNLEHGSNADLLRMSLETPHWTATAAIMRRTGFSLTVLRLLGAALCFLTAPMVYVTARWLFNRGIAALAALMFSASLWNFTLSKVGTWDADVPFTAIVSVAAAYGVFHLRRGLLLLPVLLVSLVVGLNLYEAYRLTFPVCLAIAFLGAVLVQGRRRRALALLFVLGLSIWIQARYVDSLFWERISGSALVGQRTLGTFWFYAERLVGGLFYAGGEISDIYLSPSQNGMDHPVIIALFLAGLLFLAVNFYRPRARPTGAGTWDRITSAVRFNVLSFLAWLTCPIVAAWIFEGQWRRASAAMPALYMAAAVPIAIAVGILDERLARGLPAANRRRLAFGIPAAVLLLLALANLSRFPGIHQGRWGGYYKQAPEVAAAGRAAALCRQEDLRVVLLTEAVDSQAALFWSFIGTVAGLCSDCFVSGENVLKTSAQNLPALERLIDESTRDGRTRTALFVRRAESLAPVVQRLEQLSRQVPPLAREEAIPGVGREYRLYFLGGAESREDRPGPP